MSRNEIVLLLAVASSGGLIGATTTHLMSPTPAFAQASNVISGDQLRIVDGRGIDRARLGLSGGDQQFTYLYLMDRRGRNRMEIVIDADARVPTIRFLDPAERVVAILPSTAGADH